MDTVYVLTGGEFLGTVFNGVATLMGTTEWSSMFRIAALMSTMVLFSFYLRGQDPLEVIKFLMAFILLTSILMVPKRTVQIIDRTDASSIHTVEHVPLGLAAPAKFITTLGTALTEAFETVYHVPDSVTYSKTGMLFGANLVGAATDFMFRNGDLAELFTDYVRNCVVGDILLNHKYSFQALMTSTDPYALIFSQPSPLRGVMVPAGNTLANREGFWTCEELASRVLKPQLNADTLSGGKTWEYYVSRITGARANSSALFGTLMADSYNYYYSGGATASQIMRSAVVMNGLKQGISTYSAHNGDAAGLINLATQSSYAKMRLSQITSGSIATTYLPLMNTVLLAMVIGLFPVIILLATLHSLTLQVLKGFLFTLIYLQAWGPMFAILNYAVSAWLTSKTHSLSFCLANLSVIQQTHADIGAIAGWLSLSIPFLAMGLVKGLGSVVSQAGNYLGTAMNSTASSEAARAGDGIWAFNNLQTDNVAGNKWDTNYARRSGMATTQLANGAMASQTPDGSAVYDTSTAISRLPVDIQLDRAAVSGFQRQEREAQGQLHNLTTSLGQTINSGVSQLSQWARQRGHSDTVSQGTDQSVSTSDAQAISQLQSVVSRYARDNHVSESEALRAAMEKSQHLVLSAGAGAYAKIDSGDEIFGKLARLGTGVSAGADMHTRVDASGQRGTSHGVSSEISHRQGQSQDFSVQDLRDIRHGMDVITSHRVTDNSSHTENASGSLVNQMAATFSDIRTQATQLSDTQTRSLESARLASFVENHSAAIRSHATQEFVEYVKQRVPDADAILTDVSSPQAREKREQLAAQFVQERMMPQLEAAYRKGQQLTTQEVDSSAPSSLSPQKIRRDFNTRQHEILQTAAVEGARDDGRLEADVTEHNLGSRTSIETAQQTINARQAEITADAAHLSEAYQTGNTEFDEARKKATARQEVSSVPDTLNETNGENNHAG